MIQQHLLQQQRLNHNFDRLLERQNRLITPKVAEFRPFGTSSLPGRNYEQHLNQIHGNNHRRDSLAAQSRRSIDSSSETYRLMGGGSSEILPGNVNSVMQHARHHSSPLVHAEKFEPVKVYDHPIFGPTPAYIRPVFHDRKHLHDNYSDKESSESEDDDDVRSHPSVHNSPKIEHREQTQNSSITDKKHNNNDHHHNNLPLGYITYKEWKAKYENVIPVNPLLFNIYTHRSNGSINSYGQSLYSTPHRHRLLSGEEDLLTTTLSDIGSDASELPRGASSSSSQRYQRLQPQAHSKTPIPRLLPPIHAGNDSDTSDDELSPPDSPVPYLSRNKQNPLPSTSLPSISFPSRPVAPPPPVPTTVIPSSLNTSGINTTGASSFPSLFSTTTSNIPPAPPLPSSTFTDTLNTPSAPPISSSLPSITTSTIPPAPSQPSSNIPPAPPMPASLSTTSSTKDIYVAPSSLPIYSSQIRPPMPSSLTTSTPSTTYQAPSSISVPPSAATSFGGSTATKAVTFGGLSSFPATTNNDASSSSDSDDSQKQKRRRHRKRQATAAAGDFVDDSSSDD